MFGIFKWYLFILLTPILIFASDKNKFAEINMAILDFEGIGLESNEAIMVTDKFKDVLLENKNFKIMERALVKELLKEQGFQQTGACNSNTCLIEAGQLLGVNYLIAGRITQASGIYACSIRLIEVATGTIVSSINFEAKDDFLHIISTVVPEYSGKFSQKLTKYFTELAEASQTGMVFIESNPSGGAVFLNGEETGKVTPVTLSNVQKGAQKITVVNKDLIGLTEIDVKKGALSKCSIILQKGISNLFISSFPSNADVFIDNQFVSKSPVQLDTIASGDHLIEIKASGYKPLKENIFLNAATATKRSFTLQAISYLFFEHFVEGSTIFINGEKKNIRLNDLIEVEPGTYGISFINDNYYDTTLRVDCNTNDTAIIHANQYPKNGILTIKTFPVSATVHMVGEGWKNNLGKTPLNEFSMRPGHYEITLENAKYNPLKKACVVNPGQAVYISDTFKVYSKKFEEWEISKQKNSKINFLLAGIGTQKTKKSVWGYTFLTAGVISDCFLGISAYQTASHYFQKKDASLLIAKTYYQKRQNEDQVWLVSTFASSVIIRYLSYVFTNKMDF